MNHQKQNLRVRLVGFAEPTLLLLGDAASFSWLADCIASGLSLDFSDRPDVELVNLGLTLEITHDGDLLRRGSMFTWRISLAESQQFSDQLRMLAGSEVPAHAYLDPTFNSSGVQIMASLGEYDAARVFGKE